MATALAVVQPSHLLGDDAAITMRYAARLASGLGFTYNDAERVQGTSTPLYTLLLAGLNYAGLDIEVAARCLCVTLYVLSVVLAAHLAARLSTPSGGALAALLLGCEPFYRTQALGGMELSLAVTIGLLVVLASLGGYEVAAGILLGLALWTKLDAGLLALAVAASWLLVHHRFPWKVAVTALLVFLPWVVFAYTYFGSVLPQSLIAKATLRHNTVAHFDHWWVVSFLREWPRVACVLTAIPAVALLGRADRLVRAAVLMLCGWAVLHGLTYSVLNLGDYYPWYLALLVPPVMILASGTVGRLADAWAIWRPAVAIPVVLLAAWLLQGAEADRVYRNIRNGDPVRDFEAFDMDRRTAGMFLRQYSDPAEVIRSSSGWVAFEVTNPFEDASGLNTRMGVSDPAYIVSHGPLGRSQGPQPPPGYLPVATFNFASDLFPDWTWFVVFARPDSVIGRSQTRMLQYRLAELPAPSPLSAHYAMGHVALRGPDLFAHPPSGVVFEVLNDFQPVQVVFRPGFSPGVPVNGTDGVTFKVYSDTRMVYEQHVLPPGPTRPVALVIPDAWRTPLLRLVFITDVGPRGNRDYDWAEWKGVKVVVGSAGVAPGRTNDSRILAEWESLNPVR